jgi:hypothetical protein
MAIMTCGINFNGVVYRPLQEAALAAAGASREDYDQWRTQGAWNGPAPAGVPVFTPATLAQLRVDLGLDP